MGNLDLLPEALVNRLSRDTEEPCGLALVSAGTLQSLSNQPVSHRIEECRKIEVLSEVGNGEIPVVSDRLHFVGDEAEVDLLDPFTLMEQERTLDCVTEFSDIPMPFGG